MMYIITGAKASLVREHVTPTVKSCGAKVEYLSYTEGQPLPPIPSGSVVLAMGNKILDKLKALGLVPKNRAIQSLRETATLVEGSQWLLTFDPFLITVDYTKKSRVTWDIRLAHRLESTGTLSPTIGSYEYVSSFAPLIQDITTTYERTGEAVVVACDTETIGLVPYRDDKWIEAIQFSHRVGYGCVMRFRGEEGQPQPHQEVWNQIQWLLTDPRVKIVGANFKYDMRWIIHKWGIHCDNYVFDTTLVGSLLDENRSNSLETHAKIYTSMGGYDSNMNNTYDKGRMDLIPDDDFLVYSAGDVDACLRVYHELKAELLADPFLARFYVRLLHKSSETFLAMEVEGVLLDTECQTELKGSLCAELEGLAESMIKRFPVKLRLKHAAKLDLRPAILKDYFFGARGLGLTPKLFTEKTKQPSTALDHFLMFKDEPKAVTFVKELKRHGSASKTMSTYVVGFNKHLCSDNRFHPSYMLHKGEYNGADDSGTDTGRCVIAGTKILTNKGEVEVTTLISRFKEGEPFQIWTHKARWMDMVGTHTNGVKDTLLLGVGSSEVVVTHNHPVMSTPSWIEAGNLEVGDYAYTLTPEPKEEWLPIAGHPFYISTLGVIIREKSLASPRKHFLGLPQVISPTGDTTVLLWTTAWEYEVYKVADLVYQTFAPEDVDPRGGVYHLNGDKGCNWVSNLCCAADDALAPLRAALLGDKTAGSRDGSMVGFLPERVHKVQPYGRHETYDITVEGDHSYVANGIVVHNTSCKDPALQCMPGHTLVTTDLGAVPLLDVVEHVEGGLPMDVLTHTGIWEPITDVYRNGVQPLYEFVLEDGKKVQCTGNHPLLTTEGFVLAKDITADYTLMIK